MKHYLESLDSQILEGIKIGRACALPAGYRRISRILFFGMGGSAISGDILRVLKTSVPIEVVRGPFFPSHTGAETLSFFSSYSGNTIETLTAFRQAMGSRTKKLVLTSGGELATLAEREKLPIIKVPGGSPPRCAIGYLTFSLLPLLNSMGWIDAPGPALDEAVSAVRKVSRVHARSLARRMAGHCVHFYGVSGFAEPVIARWRAQFAENSKMLSSSHLIPEIFHNEIEGWRFPAAQIKKHLGVYLLRSKEEFPWIEKKIKSSEKLLKKAAGGVVEIKAQGRSNLGQIFSLMALGDWTSFELALLNKVDPVKIPNIEAVKKIQ